MYFWLVMIVVLGLIEVATLNLVTLWYVISAIVSLVVAIFVDSFFVQFLIFTVLGTILLVTTRKSLAKLLKGTVPTNLDRVIGMKGIVTEKIDDLTVGAVKVDGKEWSAVSKKSLEVGSIVRILGIDGVKLEVESWEEK